MLPNPFVLDIGGEGRHAAAWNLNPQCQQTFGPRRGQPIPRLIRGRGESIPLPNGSVDVLIVERTPLRPATLQEMLRVAKPSAMVILRHANPPLGNPHRLAVQILQGITRRRTAKIGRHIISETLVFLGRQDAFENQTRTDT